MEQGLNAVTDSSARVGVSGLRDVDVNLQSIVCALVAKISDQM